MLPLKKYAHEERVEKRIENKYIKIKNEKSKK